MRISANRRVALAKGAIALLLLALLVLLFVGTQDFGARRKAALLSSLIDAKAIDTRWDMSASDARSDVTPRAMVQPNELGRIQAALAATVNEIPTRVMQDTVADLEKAYAEKAHLIPRFVQAAADARQALAAAMRADGTTAAQVRAAWPDFPQRERLVAAENLVARTLAEAQAYSRAPSAERRASLFAYESDLGRAHTLPRTVAATLSRLETDVHQLLLLKPLEQTLDQRIAALGTGGYLDELIALVQRRQIDEATRRAQYRIYLLLYALVLVALGGYAGRRSIKRAWLEQWRDHGSAAPHLERRRRAAPPAFDDGEAERQADVVDIVVKPYRIR